MPDPTPAGPFVAFAEGRLVARGEALADIAVAAGQGALVFDETTGQSVDPDPRGRSLAGVPQAPEAARGRGRPKLGVVAREVTLLPRHWEWLAGQVGGASVALRRLVEAARRTGAEADARRRARDAAYRLMSALAGDWPGFEEASRALFAGDAAAFADRTADWPADVRDYLAARVCETAPPPEPTPARRKRLLTEFIEAVWSEGRAEAADAYLADAYAIRHDPGDPWDGAILDRAGFRARLVASRAAFPDQRFTLVGLFADGDAVVATWTWRGTHLGDMPGLAATGRIVAVSGATAYFFDDADRLTGHWQIADRLGVWRQLTAA